MASPLLILSLVAAQGVAAEPQLEPTPTPTSGAPSQLETQGDRLGQRPSVAVMVFDYGTLKNPWWGQYDIGRGLADQIVDALLADGTFRVIERTKLDMILAEQDFAASDRAAEDAARLARAGRVLGVQYILAGSITKFATSDRRFGGGTVGLVAKSLFGAVGGLSFRKVKHEVKLTARLIDTTTGEVVASTDAKGESNKGQSVGLDQATSMGLTFSMTSPDYRESGIGEAQEKATTALVRSLVAKRPAADKGPGMPPPAASAAQSQEP